MSFHRDRDAELAWRRWVSAHEAELIAIGIPREVWADQMTWYRFLDHGIHPAVANARDVRFRLDDLPSDRRERLYRLLALALPQGSRVGSVVWQVLHHQCGDAGVNRATEAAE
jgi:hypothetical protein